MTTNAALLVVVVLLALSGNIPSVLCLEDGVVKLEAPGQQQQQIHTGDLENDIKRDAVEVDTSKYNLNQQQQQQQQQPLQVQQSQLQEQQQKVHVGNDSSLNKLKFKAANLQQQQQLHQQQQQSSTVPYSLESVSWNELNHPSAPLKHPLPQQQQPAANLDDWANPPPPPAFNLPQHQQQQQLQQQQQQEEPLFHQHQQLQQQQQQQQQSFDNFQNQQSFKDSARSNWEQMVDRRTTWRPDRPNPQPVVNREERRSVEWNYNVNYYALKASSDSRFLIRYSPPAWSGSPWPLPQYYRRGLTVLSVDPSALRIDATLNNRKHEIQGRQPREGMDFYDDVRPDDCAVLDFNIERLKTFAFGGRYDRESFTVMEDPWSKPLGDLEDGDGGERTKVRSLLIRIASDCERSPHLHMNESYSLTVAGDTVTLTSPEVWGAVRGLETLSQLIYQVESHPFKYWINETQIDDFPRFRHRGILLDTSRHFLNMETLLENLESMAQNKFNVFHWHIVDDQSFPFKSHTYPNLTKQGAYDYNTHVYAHDDVRLVMEFARLRGIRVIPEFDTPGHTFSWGFGQHHLLTPCHDYSGEFNGLYGPINPILRKNYAFLKNLFKEIMGLFKDKYIHLGGDEVPFECWLSNPQIKKFMKKNNINDIKQILSFYARQLMSLISNNAKELSRKTGSIVWQEMFDNDVELPLDTIIQVWSGDSYDLERITRMGYGVLFSTCWYLDYIQYGQDWDKYYLCEQIANLHLKNESLFYGGEVCLWAEYTDDSDVMTRLWPRAAAAAERLWSDRRVTNLYEAAERLEAQRCRMMERGMQVGVLSGPSHCTKFRKKRRLLSKIDDQSLNSPLASSLKHGRREEGYPADGPGGSHDKRRLNRYANRVPGRQRSLESADGGWPGNRRADNKQNQALPMLPSDGGFFSAASSAPLYLSVCLVLFLLYLFLKKKWVKLPLATGHGHLTRNYRAFVVCLILLTALFIWLQHVRFFASRSSGSSSSIVRAHKSGRSG